MKCQTKPSNFATGLGTLGPWGCLMWKSLVTTRTAECPFLDHPTTCQLTCVLRREAWIGVRDTPISFPQLLLHSPVLHGLTPRQGVDFTTALCGGPVAPGAAGHRSPPRSASVLFHFLLCALCFLVASLTGEAGSSGAVTMWHLLGTTSGWGWVYGPVTNSGGHYQTLWTYLWPCNVPGTWGPTLRRDMFVSHLVLPSLIESLQALTHSHVDFCGHLTH